ncbi:hypothetical protein PVAP13_8NG326584 [Panicum virgatum]|uniref:Uncharacterized protein n=1 Tax=Panicum virgatum TaxID=38727 RepID=A0A8T0PL79_PANVG|nr:hypothetical protein PVAP13_8NG326584 [Panicum virgatum]
MYVQLPFFFLLNHQSSIELKHSAPVLDVRPEVCAIALFFLLNHQSSIEIKQGFNCSRKCFVQENTPCVLWRRTPGAPKSPDNSANPQSERYRIGRFGGVYGQSKLSNILHANELAGDLRSREGYPSGLRGLVWLRSQDILSICLECCLQK